MNPIAILTDFGTDDSYVGEMKGVMCAIAPGAPLIDITHAIPAGDRRAAALTLWRAFPAFPPQTVFLVVVDPGVGTPRRPIAVRTQERICVAPDNGVLSYLLLAGDADELVELCNPAYLRDSISHTFHGRDVFSPAAAHLAAGAPLSDLGPACRGLTRLPTPVLAAGKDRIRGEVLQQDHFGNVITSIGTLTPCPGGLRLDPWCHAGPATTLNGNAFSVILPDQTTVSLHTTFADVAEGAGLAYIGSAGLLEIAVRQGNAADAFELDPGAQIILERKK